MVRFFNLELSTWSSVCLTDRIWNIWKKDAIYILHTLIKNIQRQNLSAFKELFWISISDMLGDQLMKKTSSWRYCLSSCHLWPRWFQWCLLTPKVFPIIFITFPWVQTNISWIYSKISQWNNCHERSSWLTNVWIIFILPRLINFAYWNTSTEPVFLPCLVSSCNPIKVPVLPIPALKQIV